MDNLSDKNQQRAGLLMALFVVSAAALSVVVYFIASIFSLPVWIGVLLAVLTLVSLIYLSASAERRILSTFDGQQILDNEHPRLINLVEGVCLSTGILVPEIRVIPTEARNIAAVGRSIERSTLIVTSGLLESASRVELEAVLANRISQIATGKTALTTVSRTTFGLQIGSASFRIQPFLALPAILKKKIGLELDPSDDFVGDNAAVKITRYPPGMAEALKMMENRNQVTESGRIIDSLWLLSSGSKNKKNNRPTVEARMTALREL